MDGRVAADVLYVRREPFGEEEIGESKLEARDRLM